MLNVLFFVSTVLIWGTTWIAISMQVGPVPVLASIFYRFATAGVVFMAVLFCSRKMTIPSLRQHRFIFMQALCLFSINFIFFYNSASYISSGLISVIFSLATIYNAVNARLFFGDRITGRALVAGLLGVAGLVLLFGPDLLVDLNVNTLKGIAFAALGTLFFSFGNMVSRRNSAAGVSPVTANAWGMLYGAAILLVLIVVTGTPVVAPPDGRYLAAMLYLAVVGSVIGFTTYLMLVARVGSSQAAYATVLFPIVALALSSVFEGYRWTFHGVCGLVLTLLGNVVMFSGRGPGRPRLAAVPRGRRGSGAA
ncbi:MAG: DMT family transporter [Telmatospirillum sp.]|nr:DMT family transporter [Telmatospirillum sp.]